MVITVSTRNRVASKIARGFESHRLRQNREPAVKAGFLFCGDVWVRPTFKLSANSKLLLLWGNLMPSETRRGSESHRLRQNREPAVKAGFPFSKEKSYKAGPNQTALITIPCPALISNSTAPSTTSQVPRYLFPSAVISQTSPRVNAASGIFHLPRRPLWE